MKPFIRCSLSATLLLAVLAVGAMAQDQMEKRREIELKTQLEVAAKKLETQLNFEAKVVKAAPYSATVETEKVQVLADGNRIRTKDSMVVYRDGEGRVRREFVGKTPGEVAEASISDPVGGTNFTLYPQRRLAVKSQEIIKVVEMKKLTEATIKEQTVEAKPPTSVNINGQAVPWEQLTEEQRANIEKKMMASKQVEAKTKPGALEEVSVKRVKPGTTESLGQQMIEGVMCEGKRTTVTIPAGSIGNELPLNIVSEEWYSPELQLLVMTKHSDPRSGETVYRLTNINRSEPARALFEVPADYTVRDGSTMPVKKVRGEEQ